MRRLIGSVLLFIGLLFWPELSPVTEAATGAQFTVTPQLPANQLGGNAGYFNVLVRPGAQQALTIHLANQASQAKTLRVLPVNAFTQNNGQVSYRPNKAKDPAAKLQLTALTSGPVNVRVGAHQGRDVTYHFAIPQAGFLGTLVGAFNVEDVAAYPDDQSGSQNLAIRNQFAMVVAIQLQTTATAALMKPHVNLVQVKLGKQDGEAAILARLQNDRPRLFGQMTVKASVVPVGRERIVVTRTARDLEMAPNSHFDYALFLKNGLVAGKYELALTATAGQLTWQFTRQFTVTAAAAAQTGMPEHGELQWWWLMLGVLLALAVLLWARWRRRNPRSQ